MVRVAYAGGGEVGIQFVEGVEIEEDIENLEGRRITISNVSTDKKTIEFQAAAIPERIASLTIADGLDDDAEEVDEAIRADGDDSDYAETVLELNGEWLWFAADAAPEPEGGHQQGLLSGVCAACGCYPA
jgi:hypothetical protein